MDQAIEHLGRLLDQVALIRVVLELVVRLEVKDHVEGLPVVGHLLVETRQVELVLDVVFVDLEFGIQIIRFNVKKQTRLTSQKNSLPRRPQNQDIQLTSSELLMVV